jgi:hypothetical protein
MIVSATHDCKPVSGIRDFSMAAFSSPVAKIFRNPGRAARSLLPWLALVAGCSSSVAPDCPAGTVLENGFCTPVLCADGERRVEGTCVPVQCPAGATLSNGDCAYSDTMPPVTTAEPPPGTYSAAPTVTLLTDEPASISADPAEPRDR